MLWCDAGGPGVLGDWLRWRCSYGSGGGGGRNGEGDIVFTAAIVKMGRAATSAVRSLVSVTVCGQARVTAWVD
jgi:hypothetical protein